MSINDVFLLRYLWMLYYHPCLKLSLFHFRNVILTSWDLKECFMYVTFKLKFSKLSNQHEVYFSLRDMKMDNKLIHIPKW